MGLRVLYTDTGEELIKKIQNELLSEDYKVIKAMEKALIKSGELPESFGEERDALRNSINQIRGK
jgi:hypothetical protein